MSIQTTYLTDGNWTTRQVNIGDIMSSRQGTSDDDGVRKPRSVPPTGLLSRTIMPGPLIQLALPARLRHRDKHDIVFVGDDFIQIKELVPNGHLEDIATKADFDTKILDAKVIGNPGNAVTGTQFREEGELGALSNTSPDDCWHRQILVLVLACRELLFLYGAEGPSGRPEFIHVRRPLPSDVSSLEQYGRYVAIDPRSRSMAVSAAHKFFGIFSLKSPSVIRAEMEAGPVNPIQEERFFRADGDIIAMDFLHPAAGDEDRIVLMLLVNNHTKTHIACYTWKGGEGLASVEAKRIKSRILPEFRLPSLFIPLKFATSCLLVSQAGYCVYEINLADSTVSMRDKSSDDRGGQPCTAWVRPKRNIAHHEIEDDLYLCRQDGELSYLEIKKMAGESWWLLKDIRIKSIGCNVDRGFAILDSGFKTGGDILVAAGSMGDGGLFLLGARKNSRCLQRIPNWAPVLDSVVIKAPDSQGTENYQNGRKAVDFAFDRIFTCSWDGLYRGSITELRHGIEARVGLVIDQEDSSSVLDVWTSPNRQTGGTYFLFSNPLSSSVISVPVETEDDLYVMTEEDTGIDLETQTIAAGSSREGVVIQVTEMSIHLSVLENTTLRYSTRCQNPAERIIAAAVSGALSLFAAAVRTASGIHIHLRKVEINDGNLQCPTIGQPLPLACEPVNLTIEVIFSQPVLFIGTTEGKLLSARIDPILGLVPLLEQSILLFPGNDESTVCESFAVISVPRRGRTKTTLFCGLRSGNMVSFDVRLERDSGNIALVQTDVRKLGNTSVRIRRYESDATFAIVTCGRGLWRLSDVEDEESDEFVLHKIWVTDQNNPARVQATIDVFTCIDSRPDFNSGGLGGSLVCITRNQLLCCILEKTPKTVPRHIAIPGSPKRIIYSEYLKQLVVAYNAVELKETAECVKRWRRPRIDFIDPDDEVGVSSSISLSGEPEGTPEAEPRPWRPTGGSGEEVTALLDWSVSSGDNVHHMVVAATAQPHSAHMGRVIYMVARPSARSPGQIDSSVKYVLDYEAPVRAIAPFKPSSLVLAVGDQVIFQTIDPVAKKWRKRPGYHLESDAVAITVREPYIYVLTLKNSLCILQATDTGLTLHGQDGSDRESLDLVNLQDDSRITITSTLGGAIVGLTEVGLTPEDKLIHKTFTAHMPLSVFRLSRSSRPAATTPGMGLEVTYGTAIDGTVYRFTTLSEPQWRLLRFIQNVCMKEPSICPLARRRRRNSIDTWEVTVSKPESLHVNGDILSRLVEGGIGQLRRMMGVEEEDRMTESSKVAGSGGGGGGGGEKVSRFMEFAAAVVPGAEDPFAAVMAWMGSMVQISL
ncbi:thermotolerance protein, variant [Blastomyces gilchristii SLH14081]|uniref:Thermotolerance protein n=1 Tax=Blastomyces gilchristii (strain SLH14081) TaxID=559298 RepID=A0A179UGC5_BLAGS|nr:thermotolerance protein [Blastomyces gilchristii SLH14081]XP_031577591.1 thermotolerance protein, variant [Blastomyces gilchristii SLH14081]OAT07096.1 thermotolerance protein [Blastomyces gilchristii SLH14081]OAT07097.1 thermotolerance protein, variant [Blastomyces gilchristii SLH14081]